MQLHFQYLNDYYDKIYVLSVEAAETRRKVFSARFAGLDYSFFFGADKNKFSIEELIEKGVYSKELNEKHHRNDRTMSLGEIACAWSHKMIYKEMILKGYQRILIFEDDAVPDKNMIKKNPEILKEAPGDCELLMWGWNKNGESNFKTSVKKTWYHLQHSIGLLKWDLTIIKNLFARPFSLHLKKAGYHDSTYAYAITKSGAEKLLRMQTPIQYVADTLIAHACTKEILNGYIAYPAIFQHDNLPDGTPGDSYIR